MIRKSIRGWIVLAAVAGAGLPLAAEAQITGKENVPGGVEMKPPTPMPGAPAPMTAPSMPSPPKPVAPVMAAPPSAPVGGAAPDVARPAAAAVPTTPPPKDTKGAKKKKTLKGGSGAGLPIGSQPSVGATRSFKAPGQPTTPSGGGADERRPGGVERAPTQPQ